MSERRPKARKVLVIYDECHVGVLLKQAFVLAFLTESDEVSKGFSNSLSGAYHVQYQSIVQAPSFG